MHASIPFHLLGQPAVGMEICSSRPKSPGKSGTSVPAEFLSPPSFFLLSQVLVLELASYPCSVFSASVVQGSCTKLSPQRAPSISAGAGRTSSSLSPGKFEPLSPEYFIFLLGSFNTLGKSVTPSSPPVPPSLQSCSETYW